MVAEALDCLPRGQLSCPPGPESSARLSHRAVTMSCWLPWASWWARREAEETRPLPPPEFSGSGGSGSAQVTWTLCPPVLVTPCSEQVPMQGEVSVPPSPSRFVAWGWPLSLCPGAVAPRTPAKACYPPGVSPRGAVHSLHASSLSTCCMPGLLPRLWAAQGCCASGPFPGREVSAETSGGPLLHPHTRAEA